jgi:tetratricopeptide (TPR) repeat protein
MLIRMGKEKNRTASYFRRAYVVRRVLAFLIVASLASAAGFAALTLRREANAGRELLTLWETGAYAEAFESSKLALAVNPLDYLSLMINGFSAYQLGIAQINNSDTLRFIDQCVWSLRKALLSSKRASNPGELYYVLGKAYYHKGPAFADLAVEFLERARDLSFQARDISEFLGLSYAHIRDYRASIAAFALALAPQDEAGSAPSDLLLISIARSYMALGDIDGETPHAEYLAMAKPYLIRCIDSSRDINTITAARLLYAEILGKEGNAGEAENQYQLVLSETGGDAEAYYRLGELYAGRGETARAWAEWRRAVRLDPAHRKARQRLQAR